MKTKYIFTLITFVLLTNMFAQSNLNNYKYVIVPQKFDFLKEADKYQLNSLTKFLLEKESFNVFLDYQSLPEDLAKNRCLGLYANVLDDSGMFKTKLSVELKDCNNNVVFKSREGTSKNKEYKKAFHEALRDAFQSFKAINYSYKPNKIEQKVVEVKPVKQPIKKKPIIKEVSKKEMVSKEKEKKLVEVKPVVKQVNTSKILYAQVTNNGFQIVDSTPKVVMQLINTPKKNIFIVKGQDAIVYEEDGFWYLANNNKNPEKLNIKF